MKKPETLITIRHGHTERNERTDHGHDANETYDPNEDYEIGQSPKGFEQVRKTREALHLLGYSAVDLVVVSPFRRTKQAAEVLFPDMNHIERDELQERDLAMFTNVSSSAFHTDSRYRKSRDRKRKDPLHWRPSLDGETGDGETLDETAERALQLMGLTAVRNAKIVAFVASADVNVALRTRLLKGLSLKGKIAPQATHLDKDMQNPEWMQNGQIDIHTYKDPETGRLVNPNSNYYPFFRTVAASDSVKNFDTDWVERRT